MSSVRRDRRAEASNDLADLHPDPHDALAARGGCCDELNRVDELAGCRIPPM